jgi:uncharacterized protein
MAMRTFSLAACAIANSGNLPQRTLLAATFNGRRRMLNTKELLRALFALPLVTFKVMAAIHWEALRLWLKGARLVPRQHAAFKTSLASENGNDYTSPALSAHAKD